LRTGDRITQWGDVVPSSDEEFERLVLRQTSPVKLTIARNNLAEPFTVDMALGGSPVRIGLSWSHDDGEPESVVVKRVTPGSPAAQAGLLEVDRVCEVDGVQFRSSDEFEALLEKAGKQMTLLVDRRGIMQSIVCKLEP